MAFGVCVSHLSDNPLIKLVGAAWWEYLLVDTEEEEKFEGVVNGNWKKDADRNSTKKNEKGS